MTTRPKYLRDLEDAMRPSMARAFRDAIRDQINATTIRKVERAIARGDVEAIYRALNLTPEFYGPIAEALRSTYIAGGNGVLSAIPAMADPDGVGSLVIRFSGRSERAEAWLADKSSRLITLISDGQKSAVRAVLEQGQIDGRGARNIALDIVGRMDGGVRKGGIVGLNGPQANAVIAARDDLETLNGRYFTRTKRDKRFDATVRRAIKSGKPIPKSTIDKITGRYSDRLLKLRGDTIARTETIGALNAGRIEGVQQMIDQGAVDAQDATLVWHQSGKADPRHWHVRMEGQSVPVGGTFITPIGNPIKHPCDPDAPPVETVSCGCFIEIKIDYIGALRRKSKMARV